MTEHIKVSQDGTVLEVIFAPPDKKNAPSNTMLGPSTARSKTRASVLCSSVRSLST